MGGVRAAGRWFGAVRVLGLALFPVLVGVMAGIRALVERVDSRPGRYAAIGADLLAVAFLFAFVRQL